MKRQISLLFVILFSSLVFETKAQWVPSGPEGGIIKCSASANDSIYVVTGVYGTTLYASYDKGEHWSHLESPSLPTNVNAIIKVGNSLFLGCGATISGSVGIFRSEDNGLTWQSKTNIESAVNAFAAEGNEIYAITSWSGILRTTDNGEHWVVVSSNLPDDYDYFAGGLLATSEAVYVSLANGYGVYRSFNQGNSWESASVGIDQSASVLSLAKIGNDIYAGTDGYGIYKTSNGGNSWTVLDPGTTTNYYNYLAITGDEMAICAATYRDGILRSTDGGNSWALSNVGVDIYDQPRTLISTDDAFFIGTKAGLYKSEDHGATWIESDNGIYAHMSPFIGLVSVDSVLFTGARYGGGIYRSMDKGLNWENVSEGLPVNTDDLANSFNGTSTTVFAFNQMTTDHGESWQPANSPGMIENHPFYTPWIEHNGELFTINKQMGISGIYKSTDEGSNWVTINNGISSTTTQYLSLVSDGTILMLGTNSGAYYSTDNGNAWVFCDLPQSISGYPIVFTGFVNNGSAHYFGFGGLFGMSGVYKSVDNCASWQKVNEDLNVAKLISDGNYTYASGTIKEYINGQDVWVPYVYMSENGVNWNCISTNLGSDITPLSLAAFGGKVFVSKGSTTNGDLFFSNNQGVNWVDISAGLWGHTHISSFTVSNNTLFAGTDANSLWKIDLNAFSLPNQPDTITGMSNPCEGSIQEYSVPNESGVHYNWQFPAGWTLVEGMSTNRVTVVAGDNSGLVVVTPETFAGSGESQYMIVNPMGLAEPAVQIVTDGMQVCEGDAVIFDAQIEWGGDNPALAWLVNDVEVSNENTFVLIPVDGDVIKAKLITAYPCADDTPVYSNEVIMDVIPMPETPTIFLSGDTLFSDATLGNQWYVDGQIIPGATNSNLKVMVAGTYYCLTTVNGCNSDPSNEIFASPLGINDLPNEKIQVYPNPTTGCFTVKLDFFGSKNIEIQVIDAQGKVILTKSTKNGAMGDNIAIDLSKCKEGLYTVLVRNNEKLYMSRILLQTQN